MSIHASEKTKKKRMITLPVLHACVSCGTPIGSEKKETGYQSVPQIKCFGSLIIRCPRPQVLP
jgi:hypothetical protein